jgi:hypothetical protein
MDNGNRSVHTKQLAICKKSPVGVHHWVQSIDDNPVFLCIYCGGFRAFNIKSYRFNPYRGEEFMQVFSLDTLPKLMHLLDERHKDPEIEYHPNTRDKDSYKRGSASKRVKKVKGEFDDGPRLPKRRLRGSNKSMV